MKKYGYLLAAIVLAAMITGCNRTEPYRRSGNNNNQGQGQQQRPEENKVVPQENKTWKISYERSKADDGSYVEQIIVNNVPSGQDYLISVINMANYATYDGHIEDFMTNELEYNSEHVYHGGKPEIKRFGRFRAGVWYAFVMALDANKELTGEYAYLQFNVDEEEASEEYLSWLGNWTVSDGRIEYDLKISQIEANNVYRIDGWEVKKNPEEGWEQMNQEYLEAFFEPSNSRLYFVSQFLFSYEDSNNNNAVVDELFVGQIYYNGVTEKMGLYIVPDENFDLAYADKDMDDNYFIYPCDVRVSVGNDEFDGKFYCMQYVYQTVSTGDWSVYNQDVARFYNNLHILHPMTMVRKAGAQNAPASIKKRNGTVAPGAGEEKPLRGVIYKPRSERVAKGIVKAK